MTVKELIELLQQMPQDLEVYSYCDHGQTPERSMPPSIQYLSGDDYDNFTNDPEVAEEYGYKYKVVML